MARQLGIDVETKADDKGLEKAAAGLEVLTGRADAAADKLRGLDHDADKADEGVKGLGEDAVKTAAEVSVLNREIDASKSKIRELGQEYDRTGDKDLLKQIGGERSSLAALSRIARDLQVAEVDAEKSTEKITAKVKTLDETIGAAKKNVAALAEEFRRTGNSDVLDKLKSAGKELRDLKNAKKDVDELAADAEKMGRSLGQSIGNGLQSAGSAIGKWITSNPWIAAGIAAAITIGAPVIGAAVSSAVLLGVGGIGLAGGIALVAKDPAVSGAFKALGSNMFVHLKDDAQVFIEPLARAAGILEHSFLAIEPSIQRIFGNLAPTVDRLAVGFGGFLERAMPGIERASAAAVPLLNVLANQLPKFGAQIGSFFESISKPEAARGFKVLLDWIGKTVQGVGVSVEFLTWSFDKLLHVVAGAIHFLDSLPTAVKAIIPFGGALGSMDKGMQGYLKSVDAATHGTDDLAGKTTGLTGDANDLGNSMLTLAQRIDNVYGRTMAAQQADDAWQTSMLDLKDAIAQNGHSLDGHTRAGIANREAILKAIQTAKDHRDALIADGDSAAAANDEFNKNVATLEALAVKAGLSKKELDKLVGNYTITITTTNVVKTVDLSGGTGKAGTIGNVRGFYAGGGPVKAGETYVVGDAGKPELFVSGTDGYVFPEVPKPGMPAPRGGGGSRGGGSRQTLVVQLVTPYGKILHEQLVDFAVDTGRTPAQLFPDFR